MILVKHKGINLPIPFAQESVGNQNLLRIPRICLVIQYSVLTRNTLLSSGTKREVR